MGAFTLDTTTPPDSAMTLPGSALASGDARNCKSSLIPLNHLLFDLNLFFVTHTYVQSLMLQFSPGTSSQVRLG